MPNTSGGHIDTERDMMHRRSAPQAETKKQQPTIHLTPRILAHLRRWERSRSSWVIEFRGQGVGSIKTAWATTHREAGLAGTCVTPHTLRHTAITWAMQAGADIYQAAGYFGVSIETMFKVYAHHHPSRPHRATAFEDTLADSDSSLIEALSSRSSASCRHQSDAVAAVGRGGDCDGSQHQSKLARTNANEAGCKP